MSVTQELERGTRNKLDGNIMVSRQFAEVLCAYRECSAEVQRIIDLMAQIVNDPNADEDERDAAVGTVAEALFPCRINGAPGIDLEEEAERLSSHDGTKQVLQTMDQEEAVFADRVAALMESKGSDASRASGGHRSRSAGRGHDAGTEEPATATHGGENRQGVRGDAGRDLAYPERSKALPSPDAHQRKRRSQSSFRGLTAKPCSCSRRETRQCYRLYSFPLGWLQPESGGVGRRVSTS